MSKLEYSEWQNEEFYKLAKMSLSENMCTVIIPAQKQVFL